MNGRLAKVTLAGLAILLSCVLAFVGSWPFERLGIKTPGMVAARIFVPPSGPPHEFSAVGQGASCAVDS